MTTRTTTNFYTRSDGAGGNGNDFISAAPVNMLADNFGRDQVGVTIDGGAGNDTIIGGNSNAAVLSRCH